MPSLSRRATPAPSRPMPPTLPVASVATTWAPFLTSSTGVGEPPNPIGSLPKVQHTPSMPSPSAEYFRGVTTTPSMLVIVAGFDDAAVAAGDVAVLGGVAPA